MRPVVLRAVIVAVLLLGLFTAAAQAADPALRQRIADIETRIAAYVPDSHYRDDAFGLIVVRQALISLKEGSGGIGACLVDGKTGELVETGRNRQYRPYFRSDMHAEMDLLNRYEDRLRKKAGGALHSNPRQCGDLILFSSTEPCPMCLTRIINSGIQRMYYINPDPEGGMAHRMEHLPKFWRDFAAGRDFRQADCSPALQKIARDLFCHSKRAFAKKSAP